VWRAVEVLVAWGATPYVDQQDATLRSISTNSEKAIRLRRQIESCGRLVLIVTENSKVSHWTPWEVGLADGLHGTQKVAMFPIKMGDDDWGMREYLANYPKIEKITFRRDSRPSIAVGDPSDGKYWRFDQWLAL
jgi:hypothetical protein